MSAPAECQLQTDDIVLHVLLTWCTAVPISIFAICTQIVDHVKKRKRGRDSADSPLILPVLVTLFFLFAMGYCVQRFALLAMKCDLVEDPSLFVVFLRVGKLAVFSYYGQWILRIAMYMALLWYSFRGSPIAIQPLPFWFAVCLLTALFLAVLIVTFIRLTSKLQDRVFAEWASIVCASLAWLSCLIVCSVFIARLRHIYNLQLSDDESNGQNKKMMDLMIKYAVLTGVSSLTTLAGIASIFYAIFAVFSEQVGAAVDTLAILDVWTDLVCTALAFERAEKVYTWLFACLHNRVYRTIIATNEDSGTMTFPDTVATTGTTGGSGPGSGSAAVITVDPAGGMATLPEDTAIVYDA